MTAILPLLLALLSAPLSAAVENPQETRYRELLESLRCLVCQNQSLAESDAGLAKDLRIVVQQQLQAGRSDSEILDFMAARYGDFVLLKPPFKGVTWLLWLTPFMLFSGALGIAVYCLRRAHNASS